MSTTKTMSLTRVLSEVKLLEKKISDATSSATFIDFNQKKNQRTAVLQVEPAAATQKISGDYASIQALIKNRQAMKSALVKANATTMVTIAGKQYTIASAIERKASIILENSVLKAMKAQYNRYLQQANAVSANTEATVTKLIETHLGATKGSEKISSEAIDAIANPIRDREKLIPVDPLKLAELIATMQDTIDEFTKDVDFALSEINAKTEITFEMD